MKRKPANLPKGKSMNPEERVVEREALKESWLTKLRRHARLTKGRPGPEHKETQ